MMISMMATGALSVIWMRQQISSHAENVTSLERELLVLDRKCNSMRGRIAKIHNPQFLIGCLAQRGCTQAGGKHIVWMERDLPTATCAIVSTPLDVRLAKSLN